MSLPLDGEGGPLAVDEVKKPLNYAFFYGQSGRPVPTISPKNPCDKLQFITHLQTQKP